MGAGGAGFQPLHRVVFQTKCIGAALENVFRVFHQILAVYFVSNEESVKPGLSGLKLGLSGLKSAI